MTKGSRQAGWAKGDQWIYTDYTVNLKPFTFVEAMATAMAEKCLFCSYECKAGRTDVMRKHYKAHHKGCSAVVGKPANPNFPTSAVVRANPHKCDIAMIVVPMGDREECRGAYCFNCWHEIALSESMDLHRRTWPAIVAKHHFCKEKQVRPKRGGQKPVGEKAPVAKPVANNPDIIVHEMDANSQEQEEDEEDLWQAVVEKLMRRSPTARKRLQALLEQEGEYPDYEYVLGEAVEAGVDPLEHERLQEQMDDLRHARDHYKHQVAERELFMETAMEQMRVKLQEQVLFERECRLRNRQVAMDLAAQLADLQGITISEVLGEDS